MVRGTSFLFSLSPTEKRCYPPRQAPVKHSRSHRHRQAREWSGFELGKKKFAIVNWQNFWRRASQRSSNCTNASTTYNTDEDLSNSKMPAIRKNEKPVKKVLSEEKITDEDETSSSAGSDSSEDETTSDDKSTSTPAKTSGEESEEDEDEDMIADEAESGESDREESDEESSSQKKTSKSTSKKSKPAPK